jgi:hypothetical protein
MANVDLSDPSFWTEISEIEGTVDAGPPGVAEVTSADSTPFSEPYNHNCGSNVILELDDPTRIDPAPGYEWIFDFTPTYTGGLTQWDPAGGLALLPSVIINTTAEGDQEVFGATDPFDPPDSGEPRTAVVDMTAIMTTLTPPINYIQIRIGSSGASLDDVDLTFVLDSLFVGVFEGEPVLFWINKSGTREIP